MPQQNLAVSCCAERVGGGRSWQSAHRDGREGAPDRNRHGSAALPTH